MNVALVGLIGLLSGAAIWALSVMATGAREPFDGSMTYYALATFSAGVVSALPSPRKWWVGVIAVYLGQHVYAFMAYPELREWFLFGFVVNLVFPTWLFAAAGGIATYLCYIYSVGRKNSR